MTDAAQNQEFEVPESIDFNETDFEAACKAPRLKEGLFKFVAREVTRTVSKKNGDLQLVINASPLDGADNPQLQYNMRLFVTIPYANPKLPGHRVEDIKRALKNGRQTVKAFDGSALDWYPRWDPDSKSWADQFGNPLPKAQAEGQKKKVDAQVAKILASWYSNPQALVNSVFYGNVRHNGDYDNLYPTADVGGKTVITSDFRADD